MQSICHIEQHGHWGVISLLCANNSDLLVPLGKQYLAMDSDFSSSDLVVRK